MNYTALLLVGTLVFSANAMEIDKKPLDPSLIALYTSLLANSWGEVRVWVLGLTPAKQTVEEKLSESANNTEKVEALLEKNKQRLLDISLLRLCEGGLGTLAQTEEDRAHLAKALIKQGASLSAHDSSDETPLHYAAQQSNSTLTNMLLTLKANAKSRNSLGETPLHLAVERSNLNCIETLLSHDPTLINEVDNFGDTPLHTAAVPYSYLAIITLLIDKGASITLKNKNGQTPIDIVIDSGKRDLATFMTEYKPNSTIA